jgi:hypothetical protein
MRKVSLVAYAGIYPRSVEMQGVVARSSTQPSSAWEAVPKSEDHIFLYCLC